MIPTFVMLTGRIASIRCLDSGGNGSCRLILSTPSGDFQVEAVAALASGLAVGDSVRVFGEPVSFYHRRGRHHRTLVKAGRIDRPAETGPLAGVIRLIVELLQELEVSYADNNHREGRGGENQPGRPLD